MITLEEAKLYLRVDNDEEDEFISDLIKTANHYLESAIGEIDTSNNAMKEKSKLLVKTLVSDWYENRSYMYQGRLSQSKKWTIQSLLLQMQIESDR